MTSRKAMASHKDTSVPLLPGSGDDFGKFKPLTVHICTSAQEFNVQGLIDGIRSRFSRDRHLVDRVKYIELPYNDVDDYTFEGKDAVVLCHSIHNRRFAITDVMDALYDDFLTNARAEKVSEAIRMVVVIAHDFPEGTNAKYEMNMEAFECRQPTAFKCADLVMMAERLDVAHVELLEERWKDLEVALEKALENTPVPIVPVPWSTLLIRALIMCLSTFLILIPDVFFDLVWLEILFDVFRLAVFGTVPIVMAYVLHFIKELKKVAKGCLVVSFGEIALVLMTLPFIEIQYWKYVYIVVGALSLLLVGNYGRVVYKYRQRNGLTKLMSRKVLWCCAGVADVYFCLVLGFIF